jgi:hypothetical protein
MINLITILISLLGYGSPLDFKDYTESQLNNQIEQTQTKVAADTDVDGRGGDTEFP